MSTVAVVPGDGIGPEVVAESMAAVAELGLGIDFDVLDGINARTYRAHGTAMTDADFDRVRKSDGVLVGAIGHPSVRDPAYGRSVLLRMRFELDLYANHRPVRLLHDRLSPLRDPTRRGIDCVIVRENTEGLYAGIGGALRTGTDAEVAVDTEVSTHAGVTRVLRYALSVATRSVCMVDKANAVENGGGLWQRCWERERAARPDLQTGHLYVDVAAMRLVRDPCSFDVIVTNNAHGDILSDLAAEVGGGIGCAASANVNPETGAGLYEPVHGSAPDIAGTGLANPVGAVLSAALLLDRLGHTAPAGALRTAVEQTVAAGRCTPDLGGDLDTRAAGAAIRAACR